MLPPPSFLLSHDRPGPRYTSYPTVPTWNDAVDGSWLTDAVAGLDGPASVYVHVPFCREQCLYCGCTMAVAGRQSAGDRYLDAIARQLEDLPLPQRPYPVSRLHLGGGTPTWLSPVQLQRLTHTLARHLDLSQARCSVEADPAVTTDAHLDVLAAAGFTRLSLGVQSFDPAVLAAVQRPQASEHVVALVQGARARGITSVNLDLMYGLPHQTVETLARTLEVVAAIRPDRLAVFGYAHVPWLKPHQRKLDERALPDARARLDLMLLAHERLRAQGYEPIGFDHFALPHDSLAAAARQGHLNRDFMGYTARPRSPLLGLGPSAISQFDDRFVQQEPKLGPWYRAVEAGQVPVVRGKRLSADDRLRRDAILDLTCNHRLDLDALSAAHHIDAAVHLADALHRLEPLQDQGLVRIAGRTARVTEAGRLLVRNVAMAFDAHLPRDRPVEGFSRVI